MLTKNKIKFIRSLQTKRERYAHNKFVIEGLKNVTEVLGSDFLIEGLYVTDELSDDDNFPNAISVSKKDMERMSSLKKAPGILALASIRDWGEPDISKGKYILLDRINDPGNLGTIIRIADWFGIDGIVCSDDSVDVYNSKVVQSSMGSVFRIPVWYADLAETIKKSESKVIAASMNGDDYAKFSFPESGLLLMGSESHGITEELAALVDHQLTIPRIGKAESLNVSVATGILCQAFTRSK